MFKSTDSSNGSSILPNVFEEESACASICPNLTYQQRIYGFVGCCALGWILSVLGTLVLIGGTTTTNIRTFIILYILGNIISLCSTGFLCGPKSACNKMWHPTRRWSTAFYLSMIIIVFAVAVAKQNIGIVFAMLFVEILAGTWYSISFIPFGRTIAHKFLRSIGICYPCYSVYDTIHEQTQSQSKSGSQSGGSIFSTGTSK